ncbi:MULTISPECIES: nitronate monooxygenase family protein [unclassified Flavobacterium]|uniref:NAD(P)H-dependent flavin oxidoreductase n=1 Tax=unclassified Flavobacterium TaxID=196869 RepID=UPI0012A99448|nr:MULTISPECIES: nitronate monooxygenase [unclassified Flavobacterium]MBF4484857.1 nitronate monooxygenase [Flavobacterium sp. CSZ]QGK73735.1 nitronate monooxygenase [Flavobacterium sp. SLB02]
MWYNTKATALLGIDYPIMQGPFGGNLSTVELTAAVSNAGGLGGYGAYTMSPQEIFDVNKQLKAATNKPYNINLWVSDHDIPQSGLSDEQYKKTTALFKPYFDEVGIPLPEKPAPFQSRFENQLEVILDIKPKVFSFMFGALSADVLEQCKRSGITTVGAATTLDEAVFLESTGVDMIIASGFEAGGHRPSFLASAESSLTGTFVLLQLIREKVKTPIIAAGGIANGKGVAAALALGASAAQIGTAFLACDESNALPIHREMLFSDAAKYTTLSRAYTGRLGRGLTSRIAREISGKEQDVLPFPLQTTLISPLRKAALDQQKWDMILFWGGQISPILKHTKAKELMHALIEETNTYFDDLKG